MTVTGTLMCIETEDGFFMYIKEYPQFCVYGKTKEDAKEEMMVMIEIQKDVVKQMKVEQCLIGWGVDIDTWQLN